MRKQIEMNGGLMFAILASGLLLVPLGGWLPLVAVAAACGTSLCIAKKFNKRH